MPSNIRLPPIDLSDVPLAHIRRQVLLGLTATPERSDGLDVLRHFNGHLSAQIRLPDAINRKLLTPFQYFGVTDLVDLRGLQWQRGGYRTEELDRVFTGNDLRAALVIEKVDEILLDPRQARGLGFCVSVAHADYMAAQFSLWTDEVRAVFQALLGQRPDQLGYFAVNWTVPLFQDVLAEYTGQRPSEDTVRRELDQLGYVWKRCRYVLDPDPLREKKTVDSQKSPPSAAPQRRVG